MHGHSGQCEFDEKARREKEGREAEALLGAGVWNAEKRTGRKARNSPVLSVQVSGPLDRFFVPFCLTTSKLWLCDSIFALLLFCKHYSLLLVKCKQTTPPFPNSSFSHPYTQAQADLAPDLSITVPDAMPVSTLLTDALRQIYALVLFENELRFSSCDAIIKDMVTADVINSPLKSLLSPAPKSNLIAESSKARVHSSASSTITAAIGSAVSGSSQISLNFTLFHALRKWNDVCEFSAVKCELASPCVLRRTRAAQVLLAAEAARQFVCSLFSLSAVRTVGSEWKCENIWTSLKELGEILAADGLQEDRHLSLLKDAPLLLSMSESALSTLCTSAGALEMSSYDTLVLESCRHLCVTEQAGLHHPLSVYRANTASARVLPKPGYKRGSGSLGNVRCRSSSKMQKQQVDGAILENNVVFFSEWFSTQLEDPDIYSEIFEIVSYCPFVFDFPKIVMSTQE